MAASSASTLIMLSAALMLFVISVYIQGNILGGVVVVSRRPCLAFRNTAGLRQSAAVQCGVIEGCIVVQRDQLAHLDNTSSSVWSINIFKLLLFRQQPDVVSSTTLSSPTMYIGDYLGLYNAVGKDPYCCTQLFGSREWQECTSKLCWSMPID